MFRDLKLKLEKQDTSAAIPIRNNKLKNSIDELSKLQDDQNCPKENKFADLKNEFLRAKDSLQEQKKTFEQASQVQKQMINDENDKIQEIQSREIAKLRSMLLFKDQESMDQLNQIKNDGIILKTLKSEIIRIKTIEPLYESIKDELENLRRSSQLDKNQLVTKLSAKEEEIRHLSTKLDILEQSRALFTSSDSENDKIKLLLNERKMLENRLEEYSRLLCDIKSNWGQQNLTLENQLHRLSRQVAEEAAEKRQTFEEKETLVNKIKQLEFDLLKFQDELKQRDDKIQHLTNEIIELNSSLREARLENQEDIEFLRSKVVVELNQTNESTIKCSDARVNLENQVLLLQSDNKKLKSLLEAETGEKTFLQKDFKARSVKLRELLEQTETNVLELKDSFKAALIDNEEKGLIINGLKEHIDKVEADVIDKTKAIKIINQRLFDVKKTLQEEIKNNNCGPSGSISSNAPAILIPVNVDSINNYHGSNISRVYEMDEVKFSYLKHVILKFLTSREMEAKHLIRAIKTLLFLNESEVKLLIDTLDYRHSWFGTKPTISFL